MPIIFAWVSDPVVSGIVKDYARPAGNATGVTNRFFELVAKRLDLVRELLPSAKRVVVMSGVFDAVLEAAMVFAEQAAKKLDFDLVRVATKGDWGQGVQDSVKQTSSVFRRFTPRPRRWKWAV